MIFPECDFSWCEFQINKDRIINLIWLFNIIIINMITFHPTFYFRFYINNVYWLHSLSIIKINYYFLNHLTIINLIIFRSTLFSTTSLLFYRRCQPSLLYEDLKSRLQVVGNFKVRSQPYIRTQIYNGQRVSVHQVHCRSTTLANFRITSLCKFRNIDIFTYQHQSFSELISTMESIDKISTQMLML